MANVQAPILSIELVPRDLQGLIDEAKEVHRHFPQLQWLNIPDIRRLKVRSHDAATGCADLPFNVVPHIRARDRSVEETLAIMARLVDEGIRDCVLITGDPVEGESTVDPPTTLDVLEAATRAGVDINLWTAFDPYRWDLETELDYVKAKMDSGSKGLFTQPFFDTARAEECLCHLEGIETFIGIAPVTSEKSRLYWEKTNQVDFPRQFEPTLEYAAQLTADLIEVASAHGQHAYLMPIRIAPLEYLKAVFAQIDPQRVTFLSRAQGEG